MLFLPLLFPLLAFLSLPTAVLSRRGGGGSDSDSSDSSSSDTGSSGSSGSSSSNWISSCQEDHQLTFYDLVPDHYANYTSWPGFPEKPDYTEYDGVYFQGEATFNYVIRDLPTNSSYAGTNCPKDHRSIRMLGAAWVGPKTPEPDNLRNPFMLGFKAWKSDDSVDNITYSYSYCNEDVNLVHLETTLDWTEFNHDTQRDDKGSIESVLLDIETANDDEIQFNGVYNVSSLRSSQEIEDDRIRLPSQTCSLMGTILMEWPTGASINGTLTNETLTLSMTGNGLAGFGDLNGSRDEQVNVTFSITFNGSYNSANSTQVLQLGDSGQLISFETATGDANQISPRRLLVASLVISVAMAWI